MEKIGGWRGEQVLVGGRGWGEIVPEGEDDAGAVKTRCINFFMYP